jgi:hypothetical protein
MATSAQTPPAPSSADAQSPDIPMLKEDNSEARMIPADQVDQASNAGWQKAVKMVGQKGDSRYFPTANVDDARKANYMVHPDNPGVQPMLTPDDKTTYALPDEVDTFLKSGHKAILSPEDQETLRSQYKSGRLDAKGKKLEAQMFENSRKNMIHSEYVREQLQDKAIGGGIVAATPVVLAGANAAAGAVAGTGEKLLIDYAGKEIAKQGAKQIAGKAAGAAASLGLKWLLKAAGGVGVGVAGNAAFNAFKGK